MHSAQRKTMFAFFGVLLFAMLLASLNIIHSGLTAAPQEPGNQDSAMVSSSSAAETTGSDTAAGKDQKLSSTYRWHWVLLTIFVFVLIIGGSMYYMLYLQKEFVKLCKDMGQPQIFAQLPAGLPEGTVRAIITIIIVSFSLYFIVLFTLTGEASKDIPQALSAILATVIAFYFGNRSAKSTDEGMALEAENAKNQVNKSKAEQFLDDAQKGINTIKALLPFLPKDKREKYQAILEKLESGVNMAEGFLENNVVKKAADKAKEVFDDFKKNNPMRDVITDAMNSFKRVVGTIPPLAIVGAVIGIGSSITAAYMLWKKRILNREFSPADIPVDTIDSSTGLTIIMMSPTLEQAFKKKLEEEDFPFFKTFASDFLSKSEEELFEAYKSHFNDNKEVFHIAYQEFIQNALTLNLKDEIDPKHLEGVGDLDTLMDAINEIKKDEQAFADLQELVNMTEGLQKSDQHPMRVFNKVKEEIQ